MKNTQYSWGRLNESTPKNLYYPESYKSPLKIVDDLRILAVGNLRSYGDECYNNGGLIVDNRNLRHFLEFDRDGGFLNAESGVLLSDILDLIVPCGWFLPVTPGTKFITIAGAVANDVHGKNHHKVGSFGCFVDELELVRSDGVRYVCNRTQNTELFYATIGGIGLTGWIVSVKIRLLKISGTRINTKSYRFSNIDEYFRLNKLLEDDSHYTIAWIDCLASGENIGRGVYFTGEHLDKDHENIYHKFKKSKSFPFTPPISLVNQYSIKLFNHLYYNRDIGEKIQSYDQFFYPLDGLLNWNRIYGKKGFYQYQCVIPLDVAEDSIKTILREISRSQLGSFLVVLKTFGNKSSGGLLSFPRPGITLALDFANTNCALKLLERLDQIIFEAKGAIYMAKDARMPKKLFETGYPMMQEFIKYIDPNFSSDLWKRLEQ